MPHVGNFPRGIYPEPLSIGPEPFNPLNEGYDFIRNEQYLRHNTSLTLQFFYASVILPQGAKVRKLTLYGHRDDDLALMRLTMWRSNRALGTNQMAQVTAGWTDGAGSGETTTITQYTIDNVNYTYDLQVELDPNDSILDVRFTGAKIEWS